MLCYRCGAYSEDGAKKCGECGAAFSAERRGTARRALHGSGEGLHGSFPFEIGYKIGGRYRVKSFRDAGSAGWMVRARDELHDNDVAVKVIDPKLVQSEQEQAHFLATCKKARKVQHVNVARLYEQGREGRVVYYVMEYLEGLTLRRIIDLRLEKKEVFKHDEVLPLFNQLADGLSSLGRFKYHGSLYPGSVTVLPDVLKITGLSHYQGIPRRPLIVKHDGNRSNHYLAPEARSDNGKPDGRADVYSLAMMFAEMITGVVYSRDGRARWDAARDLLGTKMSSVLNQALSQNPEERFATPATFVDALFSEVDDSDFPVVEIEDDDGGAEATPVVVTGQLIDAEKKLAADEDFAEPIELTSGVFELEASDTVADEDDDESGLVNVEEITGVDLVIDADSQVENISNLSNLRISDLPPTQAMPIPAGSNGMKKWLVAGAVVLMLVISVVMVVSQDEEVSPKSAPTLAVVPVPEPPVTIVDIPAVATELGADDAVIEPAAADDSQVPTQTEADTTPAPTDQNAAKNSPKRAPALEAAPERKPAVPPRKKAAPSPVAPTVERRVAPPPPPPPAPVLRKPAIKREAAVEEKPIEAVEPEPEPPSREPSCRRGMILVDAGAFTVGSRHGDAMRGFGDLSARRIHMKAYCMDIYEYPNSRGRAPKARVSWSQAKSSCRAAGKRLCTEEEWERGCKGPTGTRFPFGNTFRASICNLSEDGNASVQKAGKFDSCRSGFGMADLAGNVAEWTASSWSRDISDKVVKGGSAEQDMYAGRCSARVNETSGTRDPLIGFRCCANPK